MDATRQTLRIDVAIPVVYLDDSELDDRAVVVLLMPGVYWAIKDAVRQQRRARRTDGDG